MKCSRCGSEIDKKWKYCPYCCKDFRVHRKVITGIFFFVCFVLIIILPIYHFYRPVDKKYMLNVLKREYKENFKNVELVKYFEVEDNDISCDGATFFTIVGRGNRYCYKIYSEKEDVYFLACYEEYDRNKEVYDSFEASIKRKEEYHELFNKIKTEFADSYEKMSIYNYMDNKNFYFNTFKELDGILDDLRVDKLGYMGKELEYNEYFSIWFDSDFNDYLKENYDKLKEMEEYIMKKDEYSVVYFSFNDYSLRMNTIDGGEICKDIDSYLCDFGSLTEYYNNLIKVENYSFNEIGE